jgi:hypothetical protein
MSKIKPVLAVVSSAGRPIVFDDAGRVWALDQNMSWSRMPDLPEEPTESVRVDIDMTGAAPNQ